MKKRNIFLCIFLFFSLGIPLCAQESPVIKLKTTLQPNGNNTICIWAVTTTGRIWVTGATLLDDEYLDGEPNYYTITSQDITIEGDITYLNIDDNHLTNIDLSGNGSLRSLFCANNELEQIDLTTSGYLSTFDGHGNRFKSLDFSGNKKMRIVSIDRNCINGEQMSQTLRSLPDQSSETGDVKIWVIDTKDTKEQNVCTKEQVDILKKKNFQVLDWAAGYNNRKGIPYEGSDGEPSIILSSDRTSGSWILVVDASEEDRDGVWLDLNGNATCDDGEKLTARDFGGFLIKPVKAKDLTIYGKITVLECQENEITVLDLSKNPFLEELNCGKNLLTSLNLYSNKALKKLEAYQMGLTTLDVSANPDLQVLKCYGNNLTSIDLSKCHQLTTLGCDDNKLSSLDLSQQKNLTSLMAHGNQLMQIDLSACKSLKNVTLYENHLTSITLAEHPLLEEIYLYENKLQTLDLSRCPSLKYLSVGMNQLKTLDILHNPFIRDIFCPINRLEDPVVTTLVAQLPDRANEPQSGKLYIIDTDCSPADGNFCSKENVWIARSKNWKVYDYRQGKNGGANSYEGALEEKIYTTDQAKAILTSQESIGVWSFRLDAPREVRKRAWIDRDNDGVYQQGEEIKDWDQMFTLPRTTPKITIYGNLEKLYCMSNGLTEMDLTNMPQLTRLSCRDNFLQKLDVSHNKQLLELFCYGNKLTALDLAQNKDLSRLDCEKNQLTALNLGNNDKLQELYCHYNQLDLLDLSKNNMLDRVNCAYNKITSLMLPRQNRLRIISCHNNDLSKEETRVLAEILYDRSNEEAAGVIVAINTLDDSELNVWAEESVSRAKGKNWLVYDWANGENEGKNPYVGDPNHIAQITPTGYPIRIVGTTIWIENKKHDAVYLYSLSGALILETRESQLTLPYEGSFLLFLKDRCYIVSI
jgi:hypothetical protein